MSIEALCRLYEIDTSDMDGTMALVDFIDGLLAIENEDGRIIAEQHAIIKRAHDIASDFGAGCPFGQRCTRCTGGHKCNSDLIEALKAQG